MRTRSVFAVVLVVGAVVLSASILIGFQVYKDTVTAQHRANVEQSATRIRSELDARLAGHQQAVRLWARNEAITRHGDGSQRAALDEFVGATGFSGVSVIAANGTMTGIVAGISAERRRELVGQDFGNRTYFQRAMAGQTYVSEPIQAESGNYIVTVSTPIRRDGETVGTLNGAFHITDGPFFDSVTASLAADEALVVRSQSGTRIYASDPRPATDPLVRNATLRETDWVVSVRQSQTATRAELRRTTELQFLGVLLVLVSFAGFGWWNYRRNLQQVERLLDGFEALETQDYGTQIDIGGAEEWTRVGTAFNDMSRTLEQYITDLKHRERQLQVLDRILRHNLRNDLNVVQGHAETIEDGDETAGEHADQIIATSEKLLSLAEKERTINELFQTDPRRRTVDVSDAVARAVGTVCDRYPEATITVNGEAGVRAVATERLETAITELIENAVEHADQSDAAVTVTLETAGDEVRIDIADEGPGIPAMERRLISGAKDIDPLSHSRGLGLWLTTLIVDRSGGEITFAENDPRGSVVTIHLPTPDDE